MEQYRQLNTPEMWKQMPGQVVLATICGNHEPLCGCYVVVSLSAEIPETRF